MSVAMFGLVKADDDAVLLLCLKQATPQIEGYGVRSMGYYCTTGCANKKNNPLEKMYFSRGSTDLFQTFRLCM